MNIKAIWIYILLILLSILATWEGNLFIKQSTIVWDEDKPLRWSDFRGYILPFSYYYAVISCDIEIRYNCPEKPIVYAFMRPHKSWSKNDGLAKVYELHHEQYHFNLSKIYAMKLQKKINELNDPCNTNLDYVEKLKKKYKRWMEDMQHRFDRETEHGLNHNAQFEWENQIDSLFNHYSLSTKKSIF